MRLIFFSLNFRLYIYMKAIMQQSIFCCLLVIMWSQWIEITRLLFGMCNQRVSLKDYELFLIIATSSHISWNCILKNWGLQVSLSKITCNTNLCSWFVPCVASSEFCGPFWIACPFLQSFEHSLCMEGHFCTLVYYRTLLLSLFCIDVKWKQQNKLIFSITNITDTYIINKYTETIVDLGTDSLIKPSKCLNQGLSNKDETWQVAWLHEFLAILCKIICSLDYFCHCKMTRMKIFLNDV